MPVRFYGWSEPVPYGQEFAAYPLAQLGAAFAVGILAAGRLRLPNWFVIACAALNTLLALGNLLRPQQSDRQNMRVATASVMCAALLLGWLLATNEASRVPSDQLKRLIAAGRVEVGEPVELTGVLERSAEPAPERLYLSLKLERIRVKQSEREVSGEVVLLAPVLSSLMQTEFEQLDLRYGARIRVMTLLERSDNFRNPGVSSFTEYLDRKGYDATGFIKSPLLIERLDNTRVFLPLAWLYEWRRKLQTEIDLRFSNDTAGVLDAALLGNRYQLLPSTSERFRQGGTFHVLVISGLHVTFLGGLVFLIARRITRKRALQFLLSVVVLWAYALAVGAELSVVRSALMFTVIAMAPIVSRRASSLNALGASALALLAWRPSDLFDPAFQLTFVSVLAIVVFAWPLLEKLSALGAWRPTRETPYPPSCAVWLRSFCESLFWSERKAERDRERLNYSYRLFKAPLAGRLERAHLQGILRYGFSAIVISAGVQLALLPFLVVYFHRLSFASFLLNIGVSLLMAAVAIAAAAGLLLAQVSTTLAAPLIALTNYLNWLMVHSVDPFARVGAASIRLPEYSGWGSVVYVAYYLPLTVLIVRLWRWRPLGPPKADGKQSRTASRSRKIVAWALLFQLLATVLIIVHPLSEGRATGKLRVDFLDVGQGDSALVTFPDNTTLLIDGGGRPGPFQQNRTSARADEGEGNFQRETRSIGEAVVSEYLWWRGLDRVDYILATHADADHIDGLNDVVRNFLVRSALVARMPGNDPEYLKFAQTLHSRSVSTQLIGAGDVLHVSGVTVKVLWPGPAANANTPSRNNDSIVLRLQFGNRSLLLTGDLEMAGERGLLAATEQLHADVVKVAHHGSKTSSIAPFIAAARPRFAVISVGQTSVFGHPNREVVERWQSSGAQVLTTGNCGTITVTTDGRELLLEKFVRE